jgi:hypothetical protein
MKKKAFIMPVLAVMLLAVLFSCKKDDYTIEDKAVTGSLTYTNTGAVPVEIDSITQQPIKMRFSFSGTGNVSDIGDLTLESSFIFDFVAGVGYDFETTYTGSSAADSFTSTGTSVMVGNMIFEITETIDSGNGKFSKIEGGGGIHVELMPDGSSGTGDVTWTVTF